MKEFAISRQHVMDFIWFLFHVLIHFKRIVIPCVIVVPRDRLFPGHLPFSTVTGYNLACDSHPLLVHLYWYNNFIMLKICQQMFYKETVLLLIMQTDKIVISLHLRSEIWVLLLIEEKLQMWSKRQEHAMPELFILELPYCNHSSICLE